MSFMFKSFTNFPKNLFPNMSFHIDISSNNYKLIMDFLSVNLKEFHEEWRMEQ